jgi:hypothetical protein
MKDEGVLVSIVAVSCNFIGMSVDIEKFCGRCKPILVRTVGRRSLIMSRKEKAVRSLIGPSTKKSARTISINTITPLAVWLTPGIWHGEQ